MTSMKRKAEIFLKTLKGVALSGKDSTSTSARVNGDNHYTQILCNPYYAAYFTVPYKNRESILEIL